MENPTTGVRDVKVSVSLPFDMHQRIQAFPAEVKLHEATGRSRIPTVEIFRALAEELLENSYLRRAVSDRIIQASKDKR